MISSRLIQIANRLRILSIRATTAAGSGHPTSCCSSAELVATVFFDFMRMDPLKPRDQRNDRFILSKGHAAPLLYAAWEELGYLNESELLTLRKIDSRLEGHPTPRLEFVDVATGSLGQGLAVGVGMAMSSNLDHYDFRTFVLMGDGEIAEGSVWEAASLAGVRKLEKLIALIDVNSLGQSQATAFGSNAEVYARRFEAFGWKSVVVDGHNPTEIQEALKHVEAGGLPLAIVAKTIKGKGIAVAEGRLGWHGKALSKEEAEVAIRDLEPISSSAHGIVIERPRVEVKGVQIVPEPGQAPQAASVIQSQGSEAILKPGDLIATREAFGKGLARIGAGTEKVVVLDGDVENSTHTEMFGKRFPERFFECFIAEQTMIGAATGLSALGKIPFCSTFAAFFTRAADQIRIAAISRANIKLVGTHSGVSIGEDGVSQMGLEDLAFMRTLPEATVFCAGDAVATEKIVEVMAKNHGLFYLRVARPKTPVLYPPHEEFVIGGAKLLRQSDQDRITVIAAGITLSEAVRAYERLAQEGIAITVIDAYSIKPLATELIREAILRTSGQVITVEDHYSEGGLGDAVAGGLGLEGFHLTKLAVREIPRSGPGPALLALYRIDAQAIIETVKARLGKGFGDKPTPPQKQVA